MRKKILYKILIILVTILMFILINTNIVFARINTNVTINTRLQNEAAPVGNRVLGALKVVGVFVAVAMTMVVGIKYMVCSVEEKAEYKKTAIIYIIGIVLIFSTVGVINFISKFVN